LSPYGKQICRCELLPNLKGTEKTSMAKGYSIKEQMSYNAKRSKRGTKDRNGKPLSDFMRGVYFGKAKGMASMVGLHKKTQSEKKTTKPSGKKTTKPKAK
jgi:hypothetical protein